MKVFLCGKKNVGKSTFIRKAVKRCGIVPSGFLTVCGENGCEGRWTLHLQDAACKEYAFTPQNMVACVQADGSWVSCPEVFDTEGVRLLTFSQKPQLVVMDEIGFMEKDSPRFQDRILEILGGPCAVLGVIKPFADANPFLEKIFAHPQVKTVEITMENRNGTFAELVRMLQSYRAHCD
ncbi:MAG: nucleoside-triphosphatase [Bacillota bacterium]